MLKHASVLILSLLLLPGGACQRSNDEALDEDTRPPSREDAVTTGEETKPRIPEDDGVDDAPEYQPAAFGDEISIEPPEPEADEPIQIRAGPITFRNGCQGIERSWHEGPDADGRIALHWSPREVPPDAMCTMALHSQWIEVTIDGLEAGEYLVVAKNIGEKAFTVR